MTLFTVRGGKVVGKDHLRAGRNCQDSWDCATFEISGKQYWAGVVSDGCGQGENSEISGIMLPRFIVQQIKHLLRFETPIEQIPVALYPTILGFLEAIRKQIPFSDPAEIVKFVQDHLLATVLGFVVCGEKGIIFHAGDGFWVVNNEIKEIDHGNQSPYIGYHLVPRSVLKGGTWEIPRTFVSQTLEMTFLSRLAIASDGFSVSLLSRLWKETKPVPLGIQLWMNLINGPRNRNPEQGVFFDDASVVVLERIEVSDNA